MSRYLPVTNLTQCLDFENNKKSTVCKQVEARNVIPDQLLCCDDTSGSCTNDLTDCTSYDTQQIAICRNITTLDACRRTDPLARRVCDWQDDFHGLFCLSTRTTSNVINYKYLKEAIMWMVSRNKVEESNNGITACFNGATENYQLCDPSAAGNSPNLNCTDLFYDGCNSCRWRSGTDTEALRYIKDELCEIIPPSAEVKTSNQEEHLAIDLLVVANVVVFLVLAIVCIVFIRRKPVKSMLNVSASSTSNTNNGEKTNVQVTTTTSYSRGSANLHNSGRLD